MSRCAGCPDPGMCCRYVELPLARSLTADEQNWVHLHPGLKVTGRIVHIDVTCSALSDEGRCNLYGTADRPEMCAVWPDQPETQAPAGCVYLTA